MSKRYDSKYCVDHRFCGKRGDFWLTVDALREKRRESGEAVRANTGEAWQRQVERRARSTVGSQVWSRLLAERKTGSCRVLADLATMLEAANDRAQQDLASAIMGSDSAACAPTRAVAATIFSKIMVSQPGSLGQVARSLRVLGVFVCATLGQPEKCPCWRAMVKRSGLDSAREQLRDGLPAVLEA